MSVLLCILFSYILKQCLTPEFYMAPKPVISLPGLLSGCVVGTNHHTLSTSLLVLQKCHRGSTVDSPFAFGLRKSVTAAREAPPLRPHLQASSSKWDEQHSRNFVHQGGAPTVDIYYKHLPTCIFLFLFDF